MSGEALDQACEAYLKDSLEERKDFACQKTLPSLLSYGLVTKDAQVSLGLFETSASLFAIA